MLLRHGKAGDAAAIAAIEGACFSRPWSEYSIVGHLSAEGKTTLTLVAEEDGRLLGVLLLSCLPPEGEVYRLAVLPEARRRGLGRALMAAGLGALAAAGVRRVFLDVRVSNAAAISLYASFGFTECGRRASYYHAPREDAMLMERELLEHEIFGN